MPAELSSPEPIDDGFGSPLRAPSGPGEPLAEVLRMLTQDARCPCDGDPGRWLSCAHDLRLHRDDPNLRNRGNQRPLSKRSVAMASRIMGDNNRLGVFGEGFAKPSYVGSNPIRASIEKPADLAGCRFEGARGTRTKSPRDRREVPALTGAEAFGIFGR